MTGCFSTYLFRIVTVLFLLVTAAPLQAQQVLRFGTGGSDGSYFPVGTVIAKAINERSASQHKDNPLVVVPQRSSGSVLNILDIDRGLLELGLAQADVISLAYLGKGQFKGNEMAGNLTTIGTLFQESVHLVVDADSDIQSVADLAGKRVAIDELGSGTQVDAELILAAAGLAPADIKPVYLKPVDAIERMRYDMLDAIFIVSAHPVSGVERLVKDGIGRVVPMNEELIQSIVDEYQYFSAQNIPEGIYSNSQSIRTLSVSAQIVVRADVPTDAVYEITRTLWSDSTLQSLAAAHPRCINLTVEKALQGVGIPLHPGALRFYSEQGVDVSGAPQ